MLDHQFPVALRIGPALPLQIGIVELLEFQALRMVQANEHDAFFMVFLQGLYVSEIGLLSGSQLHCGNREFQLDR